MGRHRAASARLSDRRFYVEPNSLRGQQKYGLDEDAARHASVCRLAVGDGVEVFDGMGGRAPARVSTLSGRRLELERAGPVEQLPRGPDVRLVLCLPRAGKLDDIVRMLTELGLSELHLAVSERCVAQAVRGASKLERLVRVAREALRQCEGAYLPVLHEPEALSRVMARGGAEDQRLCMAARGGSPMDLERGSETVWLLVGPEGGLGDAEVAAARDLGYRDASVSPNVLRVETAAVMAVGLAIHGRCR